MARKKSEFRLDLDQEQFCRYLIQQTRAGKVEWRKYDTGAQINFDGKTENQLVNVNKSDDFGIYLSSPNRVAWETKDPECKISQALRNLWKFLESLNLEVSPIRA